MTANFLNALGTAETKRAESVAATREKDTMREEAEALIRRMVERIKTEPAMTDTILTGLRLTVPDGEPTSHTPVPPDDVIAKIGADGKVVLKWDAAGNASGTQYIIEKRSSPQGDFVMIGMSTRRTFTDTTADSGRPAAYRIRAQRANVMSAPSMVVTIGL